jgi:Zn-dependent M28 family amino/carboxypeptidase
LRIKEVMSINLFSNNLTTAAARMLLAGFFLSVMSFAAIGQSAKPGAPKSGVIDAQQLLHDLEFLSSDEMEGRSADRPSMAKARDYVEKRMTEAGLAPFGASLRQEFKITRRGSTDTLAGVNFVGVIKGKKFPEKYIAVTAHYDHVGIQKGDIYNGADDNASGTAALFAMIKYFKKHQPDHSLIFVAFDAEEKGLQGSRYFVANPPAPKSTIVLNVNMDMIARGDKGELYAAGTLPYPQLKPAMEEAVKKSKIKLILGHDDPKTGENDWTNQSDQGAFHREKIPFIYFGVEDHPDYHKSTDDFAKVPQEFYVRAVETVLESIKGLDKQGF